MPLATEAPPAQAPFGSTQQVVPNFSSTYCEEEVQQKREHLHSLLNSAKERSELAASVSTKVMLCDARSYNSEYQVNTVLWDLQSNRKEACQSIETWVDTQIENMKAAKARLLAEVEEIFQAGSS